MLRKASFHQIPKIMLQSAWLNNPIELKNIYIWALSEFWESHDQWPGYFLEAGREKGPWKQGWVFIPVKRSNHNF